MKRQKRVMAHCNLIAWSHLKATSRKKQQPTPEASRSFHNPHDPLQGLLPELLLMIFQCLLDDYIMNAQENTSCTKALRLPVVLSLVSKSWKKFVYSSPRLWSYIKIHPSLACPRNWRVLETRLSLTQNVPLFISIELTEHPDTKMLTTLLSHSKRVAELTLSAVDLTWWKEAPTATSFCQLEKLSVKTTLKSPFTMPLGTAFLTQQSLSGLPRGARADDKLLYLHGARLRHVSLPNCDVSVIHVLDMLAACPNLVSADIMLATDGLNPEKRETVVGSLTSLKLQGSMDMLHFLQTVRAPLLSKLVIGWCNREDRPFLCHSLPSFLSHSPALEDLTIRCILDTENTLIEILSAHPLIKRLAIVAGDDQLSLVTQKTFEKLTHTKERAEVLLPWLKQVEFDGGVDVKDDTIVSMLESRSPSPPPYSNEFVTMYLRRRAHLAPHAVKRLEELGYRVTINGSSRIPSMSDMDMD